MSSTFSEDPIVNVIHNSIRKGISVTLENECEASAVILILSAIDAMAYLAMPDNHQDVTSDDFIKWADKYIRFSCKDQLTGADIYGARCSMLHSFGAQSRMSRSGKCRKILWMDEAEPRILYRPDVQPDFVFVSILDLKDALFDGMDRFLIDIYKNSSSNEAKLADKRFRSFVHKLKTEDVMSSGETS